jgi:hypothetical protein
MATSETSGRPSSGSVSASSPARSTEKINHISGLSFCFARANELRLHPIEICRGGVRLRAGQPPRLRCNDATVAGVAPGGGLRGLAQ